MAQKTITVQDSKNCLVVKLDGKQTSVRIINVKNGLLVRHSQSSGVKEIRQIVKPGKYRVETDGVITGLDTTQVDLGY